MTSPAISVKIYRTYDVAVDGTESSKVKIREGHKWLVSAGREYPLLDRSGMRILYGNGWEYECREGTVERATVIEMKQARKGRTCAKARKFGKTDAWSCFDAF